MERMQERRAQAMDIFRQQKEVVEQRQRQQLLKQMREQEYESRSLDAVKDEYALFLSPRCMSRFTFFACSLLSDRRERFRRAYAIRTDLESDWSDAANEKQRRDEDERRHVFAPQGALVHEQCDQYKRCAQCQRNVNNYGASNLWKDTRYIPGARIMV